MCFLDKGKKLLVYKKGVWRVLFLKYRVEFFIKKDMVFCYKKRLKGVRFENKFL